MPGIRTSSWRPFSPPLRRKASPSKKLPRRQQPALGDPRPVGGFDQADLAAGDLGDGHLLDPEHDRVDPVVARRQELDLRPLLAAVREEAVRRLEAVALHRGAEVAAFPGHPPAVDGLHVADLAILDHDGRHLEHLEQVRIDLVFALGQDRQLRPLLPAVGEEGLAVLEQVADHGPGHEAARRDRRPGDGPHHAHHVLVDDAEVPLGDPVEEGQQQVEAWPQHPGLDPHLAAQRHGAAIGHLPAEPAPLQEDDLVAPGDGERLEQDPQQHQRPERLRPVRDQRRKGGNIHGGASEWEGRRLAT
jgi:hypothetical protein